MLQIYCIQSAKIGDCNVPCDENFCVGKVLGSYGNGRIQFRHEKTIDSSPLMLIAQKSIGGLGIYSVTGKVDLEETYYIPRLKSAQDAVKFLAKNLNSEIWKSSSPSLISSWDEGRKSYICSMESSGDEYGQVEGDITQPSNACTILRLIEQSV